MLLPRQPAKVNKTTTLLHLLMAMLTELLKFDVVDPTGLRGRLLDLEVRLLEEEYPDVVGIHFSSSEGPRRLDWKNVIEVSSQKKEISVRDLRVAKLVGDGDQPRPVLLKWDVLDALVIDLLNRRTTRACDLMLWVSENGMQLRAVDTGLVAMFRRITRGAFRGAIKQDMFDWKYIEFLRGDPSAVDSGAGYHMRIGRLPAGEIAQLADYIPYLHAAELLTLIDDDKAARVLAAMSIERQVQVIEEFSEEDAVELLKRMPPDLASDLIGRLQPEIMRNYLKAMPSKQRDRVVELLQHPEDTVGGVMINNVLCLGQRTAIASARDQARDHSKRGDYIGIIFVTASSQDKTLKGSLSLRSLIESDDDVRLADLMDPYVATLNVHDNAIDAAYRVITAQSAGMPVTDEEGMLVGAMTVEAAVGQIVRPDSALNTLKVFS
jgi:hypothetical protein